MTYKLITASVSERLRKQDSRWDERGLPYWQAKMAEHQNKMRVTPDSFSQARRATQRFEEAEYAVRVLGEKARQEAYAAANAKWPLPLSGAK
jgi:hypothetical protein